MTDNGRDLPNAQRAHWEHTYAAHPGMYGQEGRTDARTHAERTAMIGRKT
ncbi:hypothetical protein AB4Z54_51415 [Streptomyces sp. MCAF7]